MYDAIIRFYQSIPQEVFALIPTALILSAVQMKLTKWFNMQSDKVKQFITGLISALSVVIPALIGWLQAAPEVLGAYATFVFTSMTLFYRFVVKPVKTVLDNNKAYKQLRATPAIAEEFDA